MSSKLRNKTLPLLAVIVFACFVQQAKAQRVALKTDLLRWSLMMPNIEAELAFANRWSVDLSATGAKKPYWSKDSKMIALQPELRYWVSGRQMSRFFVGATALWSRYNVKFDHQFHDGDSYGAGITFGYTWLISARWSIEAYSGYGLFGYKEKRYFPTDDITDINSVNSSYYNTSGYKMMPARLGISLSYIIR